MIFLAPVDQENKFTLTKNIANHICKNLCLDPDPAKKVRIQNRSRDPRHSKVKRYEGVV